MIKLTKEETKEIEQFRSRRKSFGYDLSVANVHNVPSYYPIMYKKIFKTNRFRNDLFCTNCPAYSDQSPVEVERYEKALSEGYLIEEEAE